MPQHPAQLSAHLDDGPEPKHAQLRAIIEDWCTTELMPGDVLPSERELETTFGVSRITVRRAIGDLVASGRLRRVRGKGTFVAPNPLVSRLHLASFSDEMDAQDVAASSKILLAERSQAPPEVCEFFESYTAHYHLRRLRLGDGEPYSIDDGWYNATLLPDFLKRDLSSSVYGILDSDFHLPVAEADQTVTAVCADSTSSQLLEISTGTPLLHIVRLSRSGSHPVEWCSSVYRPDRYRLTTRVNREAGR